MHSPAEQNYHVVDLHPCPIFTHHHTRFVMNDVAAHTQRPSGACASISTCVLWLPVAGSGKTFTMGTGNSVQVSESGSHDVGILPRVIRHVFDEVANRRERVRGATYSMKVQFLELYGDELRDLLTPGTGEKVFIREDERCGLQVIITTRRIMLQ
jgi:hypothetical protein